MVFFNRPVLRVDFRFSWGVPGWVYIYFHSHQNEGGSLYDNMGYGAWCYGPPN